ncbi:MAG: PQQ-dependent sugar dehydrogenase [Burkholderiaceae bacterium]
MPVHVFSANMRLTRTATAGLLFSALALGPLAGLAEQTLETRAPNNQSARPAFEQQTRAPRLPDSPRLQVQTIADGLNQPWAVALLPDGRFLVTERPGAMRIIDPTGEISDPVAGLPAVFAERQGGLLDVVAAPGFAGNGRIYWSYAEPRDGGGAGTALASGELHESATGARLVNVRVLFRQMPTIRSGLHFGSRIVFDADGRHLFLTLGDRGIRPARAQAQTLDGHLGKVVRLRPDGSVPADNPFVDRRGARPEIWSLGHRNIQGAALDGQGRLWTVEHGPRGGDELNRPQAGRNHGWPVIGYGIDYSGEIMHDATQGAGMEQPVYYWDPVIAPSGMVIHSGRGMPAWQGDVFIGGLGSQTGTPETRWRQSDRRGMAAARSARADP